MSSLQRYLHKNANRKFAKKIAVGGPTSQESSVCTVTGRSVKDDKERALQHQNYEKRLLKENQDVEMRQPRIITGTRKVHDYTSTGRKCGKQRSPKIISSKVKSLWPIRARRSAAATTTRNPKEDIPQVFHQTLSERRDSLSEETTCHDRSSCRTVGEVSYSALSSHDEDDAMLDVTVEEEPSIVFQSPVTSPCDGCRTTPSKGQQSSLSLPALTNTNNSTEEDDETRETIITTSMLSSVASHSSTERESPPLKTPSLPYNRKMDSAIVARRMRLGAIRTLGMDGIVESFPDIHDMVVVVEEHAGAGTGRSAETMTYAQLSLPRHGWTGLDVVPASPEEAAYYTTSLPPSGFLPTSRRKASTTLSWL